MFTVFRQDENSELLPVATANDREAAEKLARSLNKLWPTKYVIKETESNEDLK